MHFVAGNSDDRVLELCNSHIVEVGEFLVVLPAGEADWLTLWIVF